jgi:hypothetical protein
MLPETIETPLRRQMEKVKIIFNTIWLKAMVKSTSQMH